MDLSKLINRDEVKATIKNSGSSESIFWRPPDGKSVVRLLPRLENDVPFKAVFTHRNGVDGAKGTCIKTFGEKGCPVCEKSWNLWKSDNKEEKDIGYSVKKGVRYLFNVFIVKDEDNPDNVGKIKLLSVGIKLYELILEGFNSDDLGIDVFNCEDGFSFEINKKDNGNFPDYTSSRFLVKKSKVGDWDEIKDHVINIDEQITKDDKDSLKKKFSFLFSPSELSLIPVVPAPAPTIGYGEKTKQHDIDKSIVESNTDVTDDNDVDEELEDLLNSN